MKPTVFRQGQDFVLAGFFSSEYCNAWLFKTNHKIPWNARYDVLCLYLIFWTDILFIVKTTWYVIEKHSCYSIKNKIVKLKYTEKFFNTITVTVKNARFLSWGNVLYVFLIGLFQVGTNLITVSVNRRQDITMRELGGCMGPIWKNYFKDSVALMVIKCSFLLIFALGMVRHQFKNTCIPIYNYSGFFF